MFDTARNSPFKGPLTVANCASAGGASAGGDSCEFGSTKYFLLCGLGGIISCGTLNLYIFCHPMFDVSYFGQCYVIYFFFVMINVLIYNNNMISLNILIEEAFLKLLINFYWNIQVQPTPS